MFYLASDNLKVPLCRDSNPWTVHYKKSTGKAFQKEMLGRLCSSWQTGACPYSTIWTAGLDYG